MLLFELLFRCENFQILTRGETQTQRKCLQAGADLLGLPVFDLYPCKYIPDCIPFSVEITLLYIRGFLRTGNVPREGQYPPP